MKVHHSAEPTARAVLTSRTWLGSPSERGLAAGRPFWVWPPLPQLAPTMRASSARSPGSTELLSFSYGFFGQRLRISIGGGGVTALAVFTGGGFFALATALFFLLCFLFELFFALLEIVVWFFRQLGCLWFGALVDGPEGPDGSYPPVRKIAAPGRGWENRIIIPSCHATSFPRP